MQLMTKIRRMPPKFKGTISKINRKNNPSPVMLRSFFMRGVKLKLIARDDTWLGLPKESFP
jgi:hypothetical protein